MTVSLDEARLREVIGDAVLSACREYSDVKAGKIKDLLFHTRCIVENTTDAIWDALSAERERRDRAVIRVASPLEREKFYSVVIQALDRAFDAGSEYSQSHSSRDEAEKILSALATQKAEGAD